MKIILRYIRKSICQKKFQTFVIVFSIALSSGLIFVSESITSGMRNAYLEQMKKECAFSDISIEPNEKSETEFFDPSKAKNLSEVNNIIEYIEKQAVYSVDKKETVIFTLYGLNSNDLSNFHLSDTQNSDITTINKDEIIIGTAFAKEYDIHVGDSVTFYILGRQCILKVAAISENDGLFKTSGLISFGIVNKDMMADLCGTKALVNRAYLQIKNGYKIEKAIDQLKNIYPDYSVNATLSEAVINQEIGSITTSLTLIIIIVIATAFFICYSSFKVIIAERIPNIASLRSLGARKKTTNRILILESACYGILGGLFGDILGIIILLIVAKFVKFQQLGGAGIDFAINFKYLIISFAVSLIAAVLGSVFPIIRISKKSIKTLMFDNQERIKNQGGKKSIVGIMFILFSLILPRIVPSNMEEAASSVNCLAIVFTFLGFVFIIPLVLRLVNLCFGKWLEKVVGNEVIMAIKNLKNSKHITNNIALLVIGISSLMIISIIGSNVISSTIKFFKKDVYFTVWVTMNQADDEKKKEILNLDYVDGVYGSYELTNVNVVGKGFAIERIQGISGSEISEYLNLHIDGNEKEMLNNINKGRNIVLSYMLRNKFGLKIGDSILLDINDKECKYTVIGFYNTVLDGGNTALVAKDALCADTDSNYYRMYYIKTDEKYQELTAEAIKSLYGDYKPSFWYTDKLVEGHIDSEAQMFLIQKLFTAMALVIGAFGIINNLIVSLLHRKRSFAVYRSIGMSKKQLRKVLLIESCFVGLIGGILGVLSGMLMLSVIPYLFSAVSAPPIEMTYSYLWILLSVGVSVLIAIGTSIIPVNNISKQNIVEAIKYE